MTNTNRCAVLDRLGNVWGPFENNPSAHAWANKKWPGGEAPDYSKDNEGWMVVSLLTPNDLTTA